MDESSHRTHTFSSSHEGLYPLVWFKKITKCKSCASSGHGFHSELLNNPRISISLFPIRITLESHYNPIKFLQIPLSYHRHVPFGYRPLIFKFSVRRSRVEVDPLPLVQSAGEAQCRWDDPVENQATQND